jgi:WD repeat-containing protein 19
MGKHTKKITCGAWNTENLIALGSEDRSMTVSNSDGDTLNVAQLRQEPSILQFSEMKTEEKSPHEENTVINHYIVIMSIIT